MKSLRHSLIIGFLLPVLLLHTLYPRFSQDRLFGFIAGQSIFVSSFVILPILEISVLIFEHVMLPAEVTAPNKCADTTSKKPFSPIDNIDYHISATLSGSFIAVVKKFLFSAVNLFRGLTGSINGEAGTLKFSLLLLVILPFIKQCILHSNPSLARGDPPSDYGVRF